LKSAAFSVKESPVDPSERASILADHARDNGLDAKKFFHAYNASGSKSASTFTLKRGLIDNKDEQAIHALKKQKGRRLL
jgi:hypothetical protein